MNLSGIIRGDLLFLQLRKLYSFDKNQQYIETVRAANCFE